MDKSINIIIKESTSKLEYWTKVFNSFEPGSYNRAISEICQVNAKHAVESAKIAKNKIMSIDTTDVANTNYNIDKFNEEINNINNINNLINHYSKCLLPNINNLIIP
jgi:hypothetical protein